MFVCIGAMLLVETVYTDMQKKTTQWSQYVVPRLTRHDLELWSNFDPWQLYTSHQVLYTSNVQWTWTIRAWCFIGRKIFPGLVTIREEKGFLAPIQRWHVGVQIHRDLCVGILDLSSSTRTSLGRHRITLTTTTTTTSVCAAKRIVRRGWQSVRLFFPANALRRRRYIRDGALLYGVLRL